jgi:hypothetical protein
MNKVFHNQLRKARSVFMFSKAGWVTLAVSLGVGLLLGYWLHFVVGVGVVVLAFIVLVTHRRADGRFDHLDITLRARFRPPVWNMLERDENFERYPPKAS